MKYPLTSAITLFIYFFGGGALFLPSFLRTHSLDKDFTLLCLSLIRPGSQILIPAGVKTPLPLRSGDSSFSSVACRRQRVMELFFFPSFFQSVTSLTHWDKDNVELFALSCNYADSHATHPPTHAPFSHPLPLPSPLHLPF